LLKSKEEYIVHSQSTISLSVRQKRERKNKEKPTSASDPSFPETNGYESLTKEPLTERNEKPNFQPGHIL